MRFLLSALLVLACATAGAAQGWDPRGLQLTRAELQALLEQYEASANSSAYSNVLRERARAEAALIRLRLQDGDMRVGDRVELIVEGYEALTDTFTIGSARSLVLPEIGEVPLAGVLRSELQPHLANYVGRFIRQPIVHARALVRLEITGAVGRPGYYTIPTDILLSDALMLAGGPQATASLDKVRIMRGAEQIWSAERLRDANIEGRTLDQLSVRAGDNIVVPERRSRLVAIRDVLALVTSLTAVALLAERLGAF